jgi:hypothetical protein
VKQTASYYLLLLGVEEQTYFFSTFLTAPYHRILLEKRTKAKKPVWKKNETKRKEGTKNEIPNSKFFQKFQYPTKLLVFVSLKLKRYTQKNETTK